MNYECIVGSLIFALIGYLIGSVSWAIIISTKFKKQDIRSMGSGNAGATNMVRTYGKKIGAITFVLDMLKPVVAVIIAWLISKYAHSKFFDGSLIQLAGFFTLVGHCFPLYFKFKGGKGAATNAGFFLTMNWLLFPVGVIVWLGVIWKTRKVSIGSVLAPLVLILFQIAFHFIPYLDEPWANPFMQEPHWWVNTIFLVLALLLVIVKHLSNIKRLVKGTEASIGENKNKAKSK